MPDKNEALEEIHQIRRAADQGDCAARYTLGAYYEHAAGGRQDLEQAAYWYRQAALQGHKAAIEKCGNMDIDLNAPRIERELMRRELQCRVFPIGFLERYKYTVICAAYQGKWLLSRHRQRSTWETQGGHIEAGETPLACAKRELFEESGITRDDIELIHLMDFSYPLDPCYVEVYAGQLKRETAVSGEENPLLWSSLDENFFDMNKYAGEGNIGHIMEHVRINKDIIFKGDCDL